MFFNKKNLWVSLFLIILSVFFFKDFFFKKLIPIPADITVGMYYPWLNHHWGNATAVPVKNPLISDVVSIIYQWRTFSIDSIKNGQFPWWNPHYFFGMPLFANFQNSLLNLTNSVFFLPLSPATAWGLMIYLQIPFALFSAFYFLKTFGFKTISSIAGSIVFTFSLFNIVWLEYGIHVYTASFLPLLLAFLEQERQTHQRKYLSLFAISLALQFYGGYPQYVIFSLILCFIIFIVSRYPLKPRQLLTILVPTSLGIFLTLPLLIPGFELMQRSIHDIDVTSAISHQGFLPLTNLLTIVTPNFWGNPATYDYYGQGFYDNNAVFPGTIAIIAFFFSIYHLYFQRKSSSKIHFLMLWLVPVTFLLAIDNPLAQFFKNNFGPIFAKNGISTRLFLLSNLSFAYLTAFLFDSFLLNLKNKLSLIFSCLLVLIWTALILFTTPQGTSLIGYKNTLYAFVYQLVLLGLLSLFLIRGSKFYNLSLRLLLILLLFGELSYYGLKYLPFSKPNYIFPTTASIDFLIQNTGQYRVATADTIPENMWMPYGLKTADGYDTLVPLSNYQLLSLIQDNQFSATATRAKKLTNFNSPYFNLTSIKYILKQNPDPNSLPTEFDKNNFRLVSQEGNVSVVENTRAQPRATFSTNIAVLPSKSDQTLLLSHLANQQTVIQTDQLLPITAINSCQDNQSSVQIVSDTPNKIVLKTNNQCSGLLTLKDSYYPGWQATIDNLNTPIYLTNLNFRSIITSPGSHLITFTYLPTYFYQTLIIASLSFILIIFILLIP